jgi:hypothetical protein
MELFHQKLLVNAAADAAMAEACPLFFIRWLNP